MSFSKVINSFRFHRVGRDCHFTVQSKSDGLPAQLHASGQGSPLAPQFPHLNYGDNNSSHLTGLLSGFTETTHVKGIEVSSPESMMEKRYAFSSCPTLPLTSLLEQSNLKPTGWLGPVWGDEPGQGEESRFQRLSPRWVMIAQVSGLGLLRRGPGVERHSPNNWGLAWVGLAQQGDEGVHSQGGPVRVCV